MLFSVHFVLSPWFKRKKPWRVNRFDRLNLVLRLLTDLPPNHYAFSLWKKRRCSEKTCYIDNHNILYLLYVNVGKRKYTHIVIAFVIRSSHLHLYINLYSLFDNSWPCEIRLETKFWSVHLRNIMFTFSWCHKYQLCTLEMLSLKMEQYSCHRENGKGSLVLGYNIQALQE